MRVIFVLLQIGRALRQSTLLCAVVLAIVVTTVYWWTYAMYEWQDYRDGFRYYVSLAANDEKAADIDAMTQAILHQCGIPITFRAEETDDTYRQQVLGRCESHVASYRRSNVTRQEGRVIVTAKVKCRLDKSDTTRAGR